jgi:hypothetical protein
LLRLAEIKIDFDCVERVGNFMHDALDDFVEVEGRGDTLRRFLQANEFGNPQGDRRVERHLVGKIEFRSWSCGHDESLLIRAMPCDLPG